MAAGSLNMTRFPGHTQMPGKCCILGLYRAFVVCPMRSYVHRLVTTGLRLVLHSRAFVVCLMRSYVYEADPAIDPHLVELAGTIEILLRSG